MMSEVNSMHSVKTDLAVNIQDVFYSYPNSKTEALQGVSLEVIPGSRVLLLGGNGSGKSTLLDIIRGSRCAQSGTARIFNQDAFKATNLASRIAFIGHSWSESMHWPGTVKDLLFPSNSLARHQDLTRELCALLQVSLAWRIDRISSGQRRKIQIILSLLQPTNPDLILLDECSNDIDANDRKNLLRYLFQKTEASTQASQSTVIFATHILEDAVRWATHAAGLIQGKLVHFSKLHEASNVHKLLRDLCHRRMPDRTDSLEISEPRGHRSSLSFFNKIDLPKEAIDAYRNNLCFKHDCTITAHAFYYDYSSCHAVGNSRIKTEHGSKTGTDHSESTNKFFLLHNVNFSIVPGSRVLVVGPNGSGKSTLLRMIASKTFLKKERNGILRIGDFMCFNDLEASRAVAHVGTWWNDSEPEWNFRVSDLIQSECKITSGGNISAFLKDPYLCFLLHLLEIDLLWRVREVSCGERKRIQFLLHLMQPRPVILLDEATSELDFAQRERLLSFLYELSTRVKVTIVYATHIFEEALPWAEYVLEIGRIAPLPQARSVHSRNEIVSPETLTNAVLYPSTEFCSSDQKKFYCCNEE